ncbi:type II toxin-antitoxin system VapC family toxin [Arcanobacterium phocae]|uniref:type II toxin-antitoxin system VapC family toxin n=1 Tax=Arcanobacterium phocae TaxID=131112 RepID=UPI001C0E9B37|nr:type II toxin-antitoxin system VapC family toxin [Arcanobacterium phocae]
MVHLVFLDANILRSCCLMDWLFHLHNATHGMFSLQTSQDVLNEVWYTTRRDYPKESDEIIKKRIDLIHKLINEILEDSFDSKLESFTGTDQNDYHVHATAIKAGSNYILTNDNPANIIQTPDEQPYSIINADDFFCFVKQSHQPSFQLAVQQQYDYWVTKKRTNTIDICTKLKQAGCPKFASFVLLHLGGERNI